MTRRILAAAALAAGLAGYLVTVPAPATPALHLTACGQAVPAFTASCPASPTAPRQP